ncbi:YtxH domain-containing protein [Candidatus Peregrinibacteria bacterium]|nr:YtxH domain-containing protein [Candidatus Peregrinibacteria bacterium]
MIPKPKIAKSVFKILTGVVVGSAIGSILGLTLAPKSGEETRKILKDKSMELYLRGKEAIAKDKKVGFIKRSLIRWLTKDS